MRRSPKPNLMPLRPHNRVTVVVEAFPALPATVASTSRTEATLLLDRGSVPARVLHKKPAAIEITVDDKRYRGDGYLKMVARRGKVRDDAIAFHFADTRMPVRRQFERTPAILPVTLEPIHAALPPSRGLTVDLSAGGALVRGPRGLVLGDSLLLHLQLPTELLPIPARGAVVREAAEGVFGVRIDQMRPSDRELVVDWVTRQALDR